MNTDKLLKVLVENGCRVCIGQSVHGNGFNLQINTDEGIVYLDPLCDSVRPGLLDVWSQIQTGQRLVPMKGSGPEDAHQAEEDRAANDEVARRGQGRDASRRRRWG